MSEYELIEQVNFVKSLRYDDKGLIPAIIQDDSDGAILMLGYMNEKSLQMTLEGGKVTFWSRSRKKYWTKGESSGHYLNVVKIYSDCDRDALLVRVLPIGPTCHTGKRSCFSWEMK